MSGQQLYFLAFPISQRIMATTITTPIIPTHMPALKIPAMASQLLNVIAINKKTGRRFANLNLVIVDFLVVITVCISIFSFFLFLFKLFVFKLLTLLLFVFKFSNFWFFFFQGMRFIFLFFFRKN